MPGDAAVRRLIRATGADAYAHVLPVAGVDGYGMQPEPAAARLPLVARRVPVEAVNGAPVVASVGRLEQRRGLGARPHRIRLVGVARLDVPGPLEDHAGVLAEYRVAHGLPRLAQVLRALDARAAPARVDR